MTAQAAVDKNEEAFKSRFAVTSRIEQVPHNFSSRTKSSPVLIGKVRAVAFHPSPLVSGKQFYLPRKNVGRKGL